MTIYRVSCYGLLRFVVAQTLERLALVDIWKSEEASLSLKLTVGVVLVFCTVAGWDLIAVPFRAASIGIGA